MNLYIVKVPKSWIIALLHYKIVKLFIQMFIPNQYKIN